MSLQGKVAIITGASSGIGRGVALELDRAGMKIVVSARRAERLEALAGELREAEPVSGDLTDQSMLPSIASESSMWFSTTPASWTLHPSIQPTSRGSA